MIRVGSVAKDIVVRIIANTDDPAIRKERILIAREEGAITDSEASDWLAILELAAA